MKLVSVAKYKNVMEMIHEKKIKSCSRKCDCSEAVKCSKMQKGVKEIVVKTLIVMLTIIIIEIKTVIVVKLFSVAKNKYVGEIIEKRNKEVRGMVA